jgi:hypothetical protein
VTYRSDDDAQRARIESLEAQLAEARDDAKKARESAEKAHLDAKNQKRKSWKSLPWFSPAARERKEANPRLTRAVFGLLGLFVVGIMVYGVVSERLNYGYPLPQASPPPVTGAVSPQGCSCAAPGGPKIDLSMRVLSAGQMAAPGRPWIWALEWSANGTALKDPLGYTDVAPPSSVQQQIAYGYVADVQVACLSGARVVARHGSLFTAWKLGKVGPLWKRTVSYSGKPQILSGKRVEVRCKPLNVEDGIVVVNRQTRLNVETGEILY